MKLTTAYTLVFFMVSIAIIIAIQVTGSATPLWAFSFLFLVPLVQID